MKIRLLLASALLSASAIAAPGISVDRVLVDKSERRLYLLERGRVLRDYHIALGAHPRGHKHQQGDERTPEGTYILDYKKADSAFHRAIHISYPNDADLSRARARGVNPGGFIMIHGQRSEPGWPTWLMQRFNWTDGCIAVTNEQMDEIWDLIEVGTPIEIRP